ncbi:uncharacterized protein METZ01_LOCUS233401 [marine metagenome]|uniref:Translesion DNA synthesis-associated protein ImuA n=1 Tax=marine metagenome TaxID=408172 RepID=A0A382H0S8_9ZZZZ
MSSKHSLHQLLKNPRIWQAGSVFADAATVSTGFENLDRALAGGWPVGVLTELLLDSYGIGELKLVMPALVRLSQQSGENQGSLESMAERWVLWISPPYVPYAPALEQAGMDVSRVLVVHSEHRVDVLWAMEQALRSGTCAVVLAWFQAVDKRSMRRLQLAAEAGGCWAVLFRPAKFIRDSSSAQLRIHLRPDSGTIRLDIFKNLSGRPDTVFVDT